MKRKITLMLSAILIAAVSNAQTADEILAKYIANTGGLDKWKALKTMKLDAKATMGPGEFPVTIQRKVPNKSKTVFNIQGKEIVQAYDGETAWMLNPLAGGTDPVKLDDEQAKELTDENVEDDFIDYTKKGHAVTLEGKEEIDGVQCFKVKLEKNKNNPKDDVTKIYYFDAENFVPLMIKSYVQSGAQKGTEIQTFLSDYQEVSGLMMPYAMEQKVNGQTVTKVAVVKISLNEPIEDTVFAFPKK